MSHLTVYRDEYPGSATLKTANQQEISAILAAEGVVFVQWDATFSIQAKATPDEILEAYQDKIDQLKIQNGYQTADVIHMTADHPDKKALRQKFLSEHQHTEDEVRFFVRGSGLFYLHLQDKVYAVQCCQGDLISVPANTKHWFDMGENPEFTCIRLFTNPAGWVAKYTGDQLAGDFPDFETLVVERVA